jgi:hypothetical protein
LTGEDHKMNRLGFTMKTIGKGRVVTVGWKREDMRVGRATIG